MSEHRAYVVLERAWPPAPQERMPCPPPLFFASHRRAAPRVVPRAAWCFLAAALCLVASGIPPAQGLHEDQLGRFDWYRPFLGSYTSALFSKTRSRLAVATARNALGVLNLRTGEVEWRQVFGGADPLRQVALTEKPPALFTLSGRGRGQLLRAWNQHTGALVWDMPLCSDSDGEAVHGGMNLVQMGPEQTDSLTRALIFVAACGQLKAVNTSTADVAWTHPFEPEAELVQLVPHPMTSSISVMSTITSGDSPRVEVTSVSAVDGRQLSSARIQIPQDAGGLNGMQAALVRGKVIALLPGETICEADASQGSEFDCLSADQVLPSVATAGTVLRLAASQPSMTVLVEVLQHGKVSGHGILDLSRGGLAAAEANYVEGYGTTCILHMDGGGEAVGAIGSSAGGVWWGVYDAATGQELHKETISEFHRWEREAVGGGATAIERCFLATFVRKDGATGWRLLAVATDGSAALLQQGEVVWVREEALAGVTSSAAVDFPKTSAGLEGAAGLSTMQHLRKQILTLKSQMAIASAAEAAELSELRHSGSDVMLSTPDSSGFRKLLVVLSDAGKVLALHNGDGRVVWGLSYSPACPPQALYMWQEPHSLKVSPKVAAVRAEGPGCPSFVSVVDAHTGKEVDSLSAGISVSQVLPLPYSVRVGLAEQRMFLMVSPGDAATPPSARLLPSTPEAAGAFALHSGSTTFWDLVQSPVPMLKGYAIVPDDRAGAANGTAFSSVEIWSVVFGSGARVLAAVQRDSSSIHTRVKVLGDRSMLVKYLNPNTVFVATGHGSEPETSGMVIHIIDTVTGRHLFRQLHKGAAGPVAAVFCENWVVYHFYSTVHMRHEMAVIELYDDSSARTLSLMDAVMSNSSAAVSSTTPLAIRTLRQSFYFNNGVKFMGVTKTARGITAKQLLIGTTGDQVYALDKRFVDPRRPIGTPTNADKEERLMPYKPDLGLNPTFFATYDKTVAELRGADTFPTALESTTLMLAYGMDLFYTRIAPSKSFDMLDDDFSYALLVATLLGMAGLAVYLQVTKMRKELAKKWA